MYRDGSITEGTIAAYVLYLVQLFDPIARFSEWLERVPPGAGRARQGRRPAARPTNAVAERAGAVELPADGAVELRGVTFGYDAGSPVVKDVSLRLETGEHVALVGVTGAGKSTLAKLLTRQYDPQRGSITLGGVDLRDATLEPRFATGS